jgi:hypothetical protein
VAWAGRAHGLPVRRACRAGTARCTPAPTPSQQPAAGQSKPGRINSSGDCGQSPAIAPAGRSKVRAAALHGTDPPSAPSPAAPPASHGLQLRPLAGVGPGSQITPYAPQHPRHSRQPPTAADQEAPSLAGPLPQGRATASAAAGAAATARRRPGTAPLPANRGRGLAATTRGGSGAARAQAQGPPPQQPGQQHLPGQGGQGQEKQPASGDPMAPPLPPQLPRSFTQLLGRYQGLLQALGAEASGSSSSSSSSRSSISRGSTKPGSPAVTCSAPDAWAAAAAASDSITSAGLDFIAQLEDEYGCSSSHACGGCGSSGGAGLTATLGVRGNASGSRGGGDGGSGGGGAAAAQDGTGRGLPAVQHGQQVDFLALLSAALWLLRVSLRVAGSPWPWGLEPGQ